MTVLEWQGEIGWELWTSELRAQLKASKGDDLTIRFSSIGGSIFEGSDIITMLTDHRRDNPNIKMNLEIKGVAASMGSAVASSPVWNEVVVEPTSMFMLHNPWSIGIGDFKEMQTQADFLKSARDMFAKVYGDRSGNTLSEIQEMMDNETWLFGDEIVQAGFADKIAAQPELSGPQDKVFAMAQMKATFSDMKKHQKELYSDEGFNFERAAACLKMTVTSFKSNAKLIDTPWSASESEQRWRDHTGVEDNEDLPKASYTKRFAYFNPEENDSFGGYKFPHWDFNSSDGEFVNIAAVRNGLARVGNSSIPADEKPRVESLLRRYLDKFNESQDSTGSMSDENKPVETGKSKTEVPVKNKAELRKELPAVYDEVEKGGIMIERERVKKLSEMKAQDDYKDILEVQAVIDKAIGDGTGADAVQPLIMAAMVKIMKDPARVAELESPPVIKGGDPAPAMKTEKQREV